MMEQQNDKSSTDIRHNDSTEKRHISFVAILLFVLFIIAAATLFIVAAVMWLAEVLGSTVYSCLIFGGAAAIVALVIYLASVSRSMQIMHDWLDTVYDTSRMARSGYEQVKSWVNLIFK